MDQLSAHNAAALKNFDDLPASAQVRVPVVAAWRGVSVVTVWRRVKQGKLPKPSRQGRVTTWSVGELRKAVAEQQ